MIELIKTQLGNLGFSPAYMQYLSVGIAFIIVLSISYIAFFITRTFVQNVLHRLLKHTENKYDDYFLHHNILYHASRIVPLLLVYLSSTVVFSDFKLFSVFLSRITLALSVIVITQLLNSLINAFQDIYNTFEVSQKRPIGIYLQVIKIVLVILSIILVLSALLDKSPVVFISGLGAMTAVLMLVFKDSILGFVASIQLEANKMVKVGDWIEMPKYGADGDVIEVSINTIKVQNWDKTITTIPTYALISDSFKNWRGMYEANGRRIKKSIALDMTSVRFCDEKMIERFSKIDCLKEYIDNKLSEISSDNSKRGDYDTVNHRQLTNLGTFRAYVQNYLKSLPDVNKDMTFLVRYLAATEKGLPLEIYIFSSDKVWANIESLQADIFDHLLAVLPEFSLRVFQIPTGSDLKQLRV